MTFTDSGQHNAHQQNTYVQGPEQGTRRGAFHLAAGFCRLWALLVLPQLCLGGAPWCPGPCRRQLDRHGGATSLGAAGAAVGQPDHSHKCLLQNQWPPGCRGFCHAWSNGAGKEASVSSLNNISLHEICFQVICVCVFVFIPITYGTVDVA